MSQEEKHWTEEIREVESNVIEHKPSTKLVISRESTIVLGTFVTLAAMAGFKASVEGYVITGVVGVMFWLLNKVYDHSNKKASESRISALGGG